MSSRIILTAAAGLGGDNIADLFKTVAYTGTSATLTVTTNIDILNNGGFIWCKNRDEGTSPVNFDHVIQPYQDSSSTSGTAIYPNLSQAEVTGVTGVMDIVSNGFKIRGTCDALNGSGGTYIGIAFAEHPFVTSTSIPTTAR